MAAIYCAAKEKADQHHVKQVFLEEEGALISEKKVGAKGNKIGRIALVNRQIKKRRNCYDNECKQGLG